MSSGESTKVLANAFGRNYRNSMPYLAFLLIARELLADLAYSKFLAPRLVPD